VWNFSLWREPGAIQGRGHNGDEIGVRYVREWRVAFYDTYGEELEDVYGILVYKTRDCAECEYQDNERNPEFWA
jgi:hypothetical protein